MDLIVAPSSAKRDDALYRQWFDAADAGGQRAFNVWKSFETYWSCQEQALVQRMNWHSAMGLQAATPEPLLLKLTEIESISWPFLQKSMGLICCAPCIYLNSSQCYFCSR